MGGGIGGMGGDMADDMDGAGTGGGEGRLVAAYGSVLYHWGS